MMVVGFPVSMKKAESLRNSLVVALICFMVMSPHETSAQRAAVGIGTKLKQTFGVGGTASRSQLGKEMNNLQGEQESNDNDSDDILLTALWVVATEKSGLSVVMITLLGGYVYLFLLQRKKINNMEQAIAGGEFWILACQLFCYVAE